MHECQIIDRYMIFANSLVDKKKLIILVATTIQNNKEK